jgi:hypothetical protein
MIFQTSAQKTKEERLTQKEFDAVKLLDKAKGGLTRGQAREIEFTKGVVKHANPDALAAAAAFRGSVFNLPFFDKLSEKRQNEVSEAYKRRSDASLVPMKIEAAASKSGPIGTSELKPAFAVREKDTATRENAYEYLRKSYRYGTGLSEYMVLSPKEIDTEKINFIAKKIYDGIREKDRKEAEKFYRTYRALMLGEKGVG